jgi:hypothetical protein
VFKEIIAVPWNHMKPTSASAGLLIIKAGGTYIYHWALEA